MRLRSLIKGFFSKLLTKHKYQSHQCITQSCAKDHLTHDAKILKVDIARVVEVALLHQGIDINIHRIDTKHLGEEKLGIRAGEAGTEGTK